MIAGTLRHKITFWDFVPQEDDLGGHARVPVNKGQVSAEVCPASSGETWVAAQKSLTVTHTITIRYRELDSRWRIEFRGRWFSIQGVINLDERNRQLKIQALEEANPS